MAKLPQEPGETSSGAATPTDGALSPIWVDDVVLACVNHAYDVARAHGSSVVQILYLIHALTRIDDAARKLEALGIHVPRLRRESAQAIVEETSKGPSEFSPRRSEEFQSVLQHASLRAGVRGVPVTIDDLVDALCALPDDTPLLRLLREHTVPGAASMPRYASMPEYAMREPLHPAAARQSHREPANAPLTIDSLEYLSPSSTREHSGRKPYQGEDLNLRTLVPRGYPSTISGDDTRGILTQLSALAAALLETQARMEEVEIVRAKDATVLANLLRDLEHDRTKSEAQIAHLNEALSGFRQAENVRTGEASAALEGLRRRLDTNARPQQHGSRRLTYVALGAAMGLGLATLLQYALSSEWAHAIFKQLFPWLPIASGAVPPLPGVVTTSPDSVDCSIFGPPAAPPGARVLIQVFLHQPSEFERATTMATAMDTTAGIRGMQALNVEIARGTRIDVTIDGQGLAVDEPLQSLSWMGRPNVCTFLADLPVGTPRDFFPIVRLSADGALLGRIAFKITSDPAANSPLTRPAGSNAKRYQNAFVSYASEDRREVLKRTQMLRAAKIDFFQDLLTLEPGDRWERKIYEKIDQADVFLLFWSTAAKNSQWVLKEALYALDRQRASSEGLPDIVPVIIEGPPPVPPPEALADLHFDDRLQYLMAGL